MRTSRQIFALALILAAAALATGCCAPRAKYPSSPAPAAPAPAAAPAAAQQIFDNGNIYGVYEGGKSPRVQITQNVVITEISTYHYNQMKGATPGTIGLEGDDGTVFGPWQTTGLPGQGDVPNAYWIAKPNAKVPAGTYTIVDSDPATWSQNDKSSGFGFATIKGTPAK